MELIRMFINIAKNKLQEFKIKELEIKSIYNNHTHLALVIEITKNFFDKIEYIINNKNLEIEIKNNENNIFKGIISEFMIEKLENDAYFIQFEAFDFSYILSKNNHIRIYQDYNITYKEIIEDIVSKLNLNYIISDKLNKKIDRIFYQREDDWSFIVRLLSYINEAIFINESGLIMFGIQNFDALELKNA